MRDPDVLLPRCTASVERGVTALRYLGRAAALANSADVERNVLGFDHGSQRWCKRQML